jgi:ABC-type multidrug transport system fused ATPase/permease subunit
MSKKPLLFSELFIIFIVSINFIFIGLGVFNINSLDISLLVLYFTLSLRSFSYSSQILISFSKMKIEMSSFISLTNKLELISQFQKKNSNVYNTVSLSKIIITDLTFNFDKAISIFNEINIEIPLQTHVLINGNSGVGKSTFLDILVGLYPVQKGSILIYDLNNRIIENSYNLYGYVSQNVGLFGETLIECICGNKDYNVEKFSKIINLCNLNYISSNPLNFNILSFSGGEKLRIALARALYYNRPILILDESLSSIEHTLEIKIIEDIKLNFPNITLFQVVHERTDITSANYRLLFTHNKIELINIK